MASVNDPQSFREQYRTELDNLNTRPMHDADRAVIRDYLTRNTGGLEPSTLAQYGRVLRKASEHSPVPLIEFDERAFWDLRSKLSTDPACNPNGPDPLADSTVHNYMVAVRQFMHHVGREWAGSIELRSPDPPTVDPDSMLTQPEIARLRETATRTRDIALIEFLADTGARLSMILSLRVQDVSLDGEKTYYRPNPNALGLKGAPVIEYPIIDAKGVMRSYLHHNHPRPGDDEVAFFHKVVDPTHPLDESDDGCLDPSHVRKRLVKLAKAADVSKPANPHNFRRSAITRMDREGYTRTEIEQRVGWDLDSDMWERYLHLKAEQVNEGMWVKAGVSEPTGESSARREWCPNCNERLPPKTSVCPACAAPVTKGARDALASMEGTMIDDLSMGELTPLQRRLVGAALQLGRGDPAVHPDLPEETGASESESASSD